MPHPPKIPPEAELRRARSLLADLPGILWEADATSMAFTFVSDGVRDVLGYDASEWLADPGFWTDHLHPADRDRMVARLVRIGNDGGAFDEEYRLRAHDGSWIWVRDRGRALDEEGARRSIRGLMIDVTKARRADRDHEAMEGRFQRVIEHLPAIVYLEAVTREANGIGEMLYVSPQVQEILGFSPDEWLADPVAWARQFHPDDRARIREEYDRIEQTGGPFHADYRMYTRTGEIRWFRDEATLVRDDEGALAYWQGIMFDVTAERESEERARSSEERYRTLVEQIPAIVYREDVTGDGLQIVYINAQVEQFLGISPKEWVRDPHVWLEAIHPDDRELVEQENRRTELTGEPFLIQYRMVARDGRLVWFRDHAVLVRGPDGEPAYWQGVMMDITPLKEATGQLSEAEARYRTLVEQIPAIAYIDPVEEGPTVYISPQVGSILGYEPEEWYADPGLWSKIVHPDDRGLMERGAVHAEPHAATYRLIARDGHVVWVQDQARLVLDPDGRPVYWQGVLIDVTEQRRTEELERDLERERLEAERLRMEDELKTTFLQAVSHDLRTPLAAILGLAVTMERDDVEITDVEHRDMARRIASNARKLDRIVTDFLDLERLNRGLAEIHLEPIDVGALIREIVANSELVAERRLSIDVAPITVKADPAMVERIVENLLGNTVKHTPGDSRIWVRLERTDEGAMLIVEDDGPGVAAADRERIFEAFRQGAGAGSGSGVGLALVARFAELHDGRAWVQDRVGGGASFRVTLAAEPAVRTRDIDLTELDVDQTTDQPTDQPTGTGSPDDSHA
jgi:PAS domain S-box-containing protein